MRKVWKMVGSAAFFSLLAVMFQAKTYAYTDGLLDGKTMFRGSGVTSSTYEVVTKWTDNNIGSRSYEVLTPVQSLKNVGWHTFSEPVSINSFMLMANDKLDIVFYNEANEVIYKHGFDFSENHTRVTLPQVIDHVKTVALISSNTDDRTAVYEFEVYGAETGDQ